MRRFAAVAAASVALSACALKGDVRRVERELQRQAQESARADSAHSVRLDRILVLQQEILDSLIVEQRRLQALYGDMRADMTEVQRQLVQIQELTGQSQQRLTELRGQLQGRLREVNDGGFPPSGGAPAPAPAGGGAAPSMAPQELYELSLQQLWRGSPQTARAGFRKFLDDYPRHELAADAQYLVGESWDPTNPDSARAEYEKVVERYADSRRAPSALYKLGLIAEREGDREAAQLYYLRVVSGYPRSDEAELARSKLDTSGR